MLGGILSSDWAIGGEHSIPVFTRMEQSWGDVNLLCSKGLTKHVSTEQMLGSRLPGLFPEDLAHHGLEGPGQGRPRLVLGSLVEDRDQ